jgi:murein L,D-transpeptidase YafK
MLLVGVAMGLQYIKSIGKRIRPLIEGHPLIKLAVAALVLTAVGLAIRDFWPVPSPPPNAEADLVVVYKAARRLDLYRSGVLLKSYAVSLGTDPVGPKWREGDGRTPEGVYRIDYRKADSSFHRALHISYPAPKDIAAARSSGVSPGGLVMIHGTKNGLSQRGREQLPADWTDGCVAVSDQDIDEIWRAVPVGTTIILVP